MVLRRKWKIAQDVQSILLLIGQVEYRIKVKSVLKIMDILVIVIIPSCDSKFRCFNSSTAWLSLEALFGSLKICQICIS